MEIDTIGIDLGKTIFHLVGLNRAGEVVVRRKCSRLQLLRFTSNLHVRLIGMEACGGAHFLGRALREQGHEVRLMPAQYVKPYVKTNKNDYVDAEAIAEAVGRANMRFVSIKSDEQLDMQSLHRVRDRRVAGRTSVINQIRGLLLERGITFRKGRRQWMICVFDCARHDGPKPSLASNLPSAWIVNSSKTCAATGLIPSIGKHSWIFSRLSITTVTKRSRASFTSSTRRAPDHLLCR